MFNSRTNFMVFIFIWTEYFACEAAYKLIMWNSLLKDEVCQRLDKFCIHQVVVLEGAANQLLSVPNSN